MALSLVSRAVANTAKTIGRLRFFSSPADFGGKCPKPLADDPCGTEADKVKKIKEKDEFVSMWANPECCLETTSVICEQPYRADVFLWRPSNKNRKYQQTWVECGKIVVAPKPKCHNLKLNWPLPEKRKRRKPDPKVTAQNCDLVQTGQCPSYKTKGCKPARKPPTCKRFRDKLICEKVKAPSPSFSECQKPEIRKARPIECRCLALPAGCDIWTQMRLMGIKAK